MKKLIIGAGERRVPGATHHDIQPLSGIDIVCDFWDLPQYLGPPDGYDRIETTHFLEHIPMARTQEALLLIRGLLKKDGVLYIEVPNFYWHALKILENPLDRQIVEYAFGGQLNEWDYHYNGFTPQLLEEDLTLAGFADIEITPNSSIEALAVRP